MQRVKVISSNVLEVGWEDGILEVLFLNGLYRYFDVPESAFTRLLAAPSIGTYMHGVIKPTYRCERVKEQLMPAPDAVESLEALRDALSGTTKPIQQPSVGRIVHYILPAGSNQGQHRPAIIVNTWGHDDITLRIQLQVFTDGRNDGDEYASGLHWATSVLYADPDKHEFGTWHFPEYVPAK